MAISNRRPSPPSFNPLPRRTRPFFFLPFQMLSTVEKRLPLLLVPLPQGSLPLPPPPPPPQPPAGATPTR